MSVWFCYDFSRLSLQSLQSLLDWLPMAVCSLISLSPTSHEWFPQANKERIKQKPGNFAGKNVTENEGQAGCVWAPENLHMFCLLSLLSPPHATCFCSAEWLSDMIGAAVWRLQCALMERTSGPVGSSDSALVGPVSQT